MNPWLSQQLAEARTDDWLRAADRRRQRAAVRSGPPAGTSRPTLEAARSSFGSLLIRAGQRISGPTAVGDARLA